MAAKAVASWVKVFEEDGSGAMLEDKVYVWDGTSIVKMIDSKTGIVKDYFDAGVLEISGGASNNGKFFYTKDHLGSVREVVAANGDLQGRYDYSPFGMRESLEGSFESEFGFTGHHFHQKSCLVLTLYRAYDPNLGKWLSADPLSGNMIKIPLQNKHWDEINDTIFAYNGQGELLPEGSNLYGYVGNDGVNSIDPLGLGSYGDGFMGDRWFDKMKGGREAYSKGQGLVGEAALMCTGAGGLARGVGLRFEIGSWKMGGKWMKNKLHFYLGKGLDKHHLPYEAKNWWKNFKNVVKNWFK